MSTTNTTPVTDTLDQIRTRPADANEILRQIKAVNLWALPSCGARKFTAHVGEDSEGRFVDGVQFDVSRNRRFLVIVLAADDTYTVLRGRRTKRAGLPSVELDDQREDGVPAIATDVYCEDLARVVVRMGDVA